MSTGLQQQQKGYHMKNLNFSHINNINVDKCIFSLFLTPGWYKKRRKVYIIPHMEYKHTSKSNHQFRRH